MAGAPRPRNLDALPAPARRRAADTPFLTTMAAPLQPTLITAARITRRRMGVLTFVLFVTGTASLLMADLLWGMPLDGWNWVVWALFTALFSLVAFGAAHAIFGFMVRRQGGDPCAITRSLAPEEEAGIP